MTDTEWAVVRPLLPVPGWMRGRGGRPEAYCHRAMLDAIRYLVDNGIKWRGATRGRTDQVAEDGKELMKPRPVSMACPLRPHASLVMAGCEAGRSRSRASRPSGCNKQRGRLDGRARANLRLCLVIA
ncbi:transposase [Streptomyces sp. NL15-2K]|uniref:transposase n=1 Tax=Streptomyces sp. NL15-2K TaxID=376149 RepID=UPI0035B562CD